MNQIINAHNLLPIDKYTIVINDDTIIVEYNNIAKIQYKLTNKNTVILHGYNYTGAHLINLVRSKLLINFCIEKYKELVIDIDIFEEYMLILNTLLNSNIHNYCTICGNLNSEYSNQITEIKSCDKIECSINFYHIVSDSRVITCFNNDPRVCMFLIKILLKGAFHSKGDAAFKPLPKINNITNTLDFISMIPLDFKNGSFDKIINLMTNSADDWALSNQITNIEYCILKNAVSNNYFSMSSRTNVVKNNETIFIHVNHSTKIENNFDGKLSYLFHGSSIESWYPIIKNGLKVFSGTALQTNGAAYGAGVYLSDNFGMSLSYSNRSINSIYVVGVFQLAEDIQKYKKASNIYVVNDEKILLLRSLIVSNTYFSGKVVTDLNNYFLKDIPLTKSTSAISINIVKNRRLNSEFKELEKDQRINELIIIDELKSWNLKLNIGIEIQINFLNYPLSPPHFVILSDVSNMPCIKNIIDNESTLKILMLDPSVWKLTNKLSHVLDKLYEYI